MGTNEPRYELWRIGLSERTSWLVGTSDDRPFLERTGNHRRSLFLAIEDNPPHYAVFDIRIGKLVWTTMNEVELNECALLEKH